MRILYLTSGTGSYHCGSCMRDNALVKELRALGHDATMLPLYMPLTLDEEDTSAGLPVMMGGVNTYLQQKSALFRKTPRWIDKVFDSPAILSAAGKFAGTTSPSELGDITLSMMLGETGNQHKEIDRLAEWAKENTKPDIICLSNALLLGVARRLKAEFNVPVVCCFQGEDSFVDALDEPFKTQTWEAMSERARECEALVAISHYYADVMAERLNLPREKMQVVYNGINLDGFAPATQAPEHPTLGFFARNCFSKGLHTVVDAFVLLKQRDTLPNLKLRVAGTRAAGDEKFVAAQQEKIECAGFTADAKFLPPLSREEKIQFLQSLSALSVPATYGEAFGLYLIEAWACGVPVAQPKSGAFPELIQETGGGVLFEPNDPESLADAVENLLANPDTARQFGKNAHEMTLRCFSAQTMAENFIKVLEPLV
jgi:glycosyltransferase involved in cell wall biosynthesis